MRLDVIDTPGECRGCGACCFTGRVPWAVGEVPPAALRWTSFNGTGLIGDPCPSLDTDSGECMIYEDRPAICRDFARDSLACRSNLDARHPITSRRVPADQ